MGMGMLGAMAGAGQAIEGVGKQMFASSLEQDRQNFLIEKQRMLAVESENRQVARADTERTKRNDRIETAKTGLLNSAMASKYGQSDAAVSDADAGNTDTPLSQEQRDVIDMSKKQDRSKLASDPMTIIRAEHAAGEMSGKDFSKTVFDERRADRADASASQKAAMDQLKYALDERKVDIRDKQVMAMIAKVGSSGGGSGATSAFIQQFDKIKKEMPDWSSDQILSYMNQSKTPGDSYSQTESIDPLTGKPVVKTTRKGSGTAPGDKPVSTGKPWERKW